ncbi:hypothetical protein COR24_16860 [Vibrio cholerae]|nr:hypothetical protein [Vibrio cholerae]EGR5456646.1 hypothetical protein [Vibrio cholerae]EGR5464076.1 hypothetical protein [Vibrio cholerae]
MLNAYNRFESNIKQTRALKDVHLFLSETVKVPMDFDDLLRAQLVYAVSAFDKLIHDIIRIGLLEIFNGSRPQTPKYLNEPFTMSVVNDLRGATLPPASHYFELAVVQKLKIVSYQDPQKISDGLSYIWLEKQKWQTIAAEMGQDHKTVKTTLKLIADRRNMIVHESDLHPFSNEKHAISAQDVDDSINFIEKCGTAIYKLITFPTQP